MGARVPTKFKERKAALKSGKQRRAQIVARRKKSNSAVEWIDPDSLTENWPRGAIAANHAGLGLLNSYSYPPFYYVDKPFTCRDCGAEEIWRATQQKWFYEVVKGDLAATAVRCLSCRRKERQRRAKARADSLPGLLAKSAKKTRADAV